jgi:HK97 family phage portal protein
VRSLISAIASSNRGLPPVPYVSQRTGGVTSAFMGRNDAEAQLKAFGSVGTLFSIVSRISTAVSTSQWGLYRKNEDRRRVTAKPGEETEDTRVEVTRHAALDLWTTPNPFYTQGEFGETFQQHLDLTGEAIWIIKKMGGLPVGLWPVRPDRMEPIPHPTKYLAGWIYKGPDGEKIPLGVDEVIQIRMPNPLDPYRGLGPVQALMVDLDSARYSSEWNRNFFINSAEPGGIIEVDRSLDDTEFAEMTARWREQHQGVAQAHRVAVIEQGRWVDRRYTMRDMQFAELRELASETIREAYGFPKSMLGSVQDVNKANALAGEIVFARWLVVPRLERIKWSLNSRYLPMFGPTGQGVEFDYVDPSLKVRDPDADNAELATKALAAQQLVSAGYDPADVLMAVCLPPMKFKEPPKPVAPPKSDPAEPDGDDEPQTP